MQPLGIASPLSIAPTALGRGAAALAISQVRFALTASKVCECMSPSVAAHQACDLAVAGIWQAMQREEPMVCCVWFVISALLPKPLAAWQLRQRVLLSALIRSCGLLPVECVVWQSQQNICWESLVQCPLWT